MSCIFVRLYAYSVYFCIECSDVGHRKDSNFLMKNTMPLNIPANAHLMVGLNKYTTLFNVKTWST